LVKLGQQFVHLTLELEDARLAAQGGLMPAAQVFLLGLYGVA